MSQAFIEGLRYYPTGQVALDGNDCEATYSGNTHHRGSSVFEHMETDLRSRLDIAPAEMEWREDQLPAGVGAGEAPVDDPAYGEGARAPEAVRIRRGEIQARCGRVCGTR